MLAPFTRNGCKRKVRTMTTVIIATAAISTISKRDAKKIFIPLEIGRGLGNSRLIIFNYKLRHFVDSIFITRPRSLTDSYIHYFLKTKKNNTAQRIVSSLIWDFPIIGYN